jgi:hypothetical protein
MNLLALTARLDRLLQYLDSQVKTYPTTAVGVTATAGAATYAKDGTWVEIIPASTVTTDYSVVAMALDIITTVDEYEIELGTGTAASEVVVSTHKFASAITSGETRIDISSMAQIPANTRLAVRLSSKDGSNSANVSVEYIDGLTP